MKTMNFINKPSKKVSKMKKIIIILVTILITVNCFTQEQNTVCSGTLTGVTPTHIEYENVSFGDTIPYDDVFYKFTPNEDLTISITLNYTDGIEKNILLYRDPNSPVELTSSFSSNGTSKTITYHCIAGIHYFIRVVVFDLLGGDFTLSLKDVSPFTINANASNGTVSGGGTFVKNSECVVSAIPAPCYHFVNWSENGSVVSDDIEYSFDVSSNRNLVANFEMNKYEIQSFAYNGNITPSKNVTCGSSAKFDFFPNDCYEFYKLFIDGEETSAENNSAYTFVDIQENSVICPVFKKKQHTIISSNSMYGYIWPSGTKSYICGDTVTYCFYPQTLPNQECELDYIVIDEVDTIYATNPAITNNCYTFKYINQPHKIRAVFKLVTFTILAFADEHSTITPISIEVPKNENYNFLIEVDDCYEIDRVLIDGTYNESATVQVKYTGVYSFINVTEDHTIEIFTKQKEFIITALAENGTITPTPTQIVTCGDYQTFTFDPIDDCYEFDGLFVDGLPVVAVNYPEYTFTNVKANHTILAKFKQKQYPIASSSSLYGYITPSGTTSVPCGENQTYCFVSQTWPNPESVLDYIVVDGNTYYADANEIINNCYTFSNVKEPHQIFAAFKRVTFTISATADSHSSITPNGTIEVIKGENYDFLITVTNDCYEIDSVFIDGAYDHSATIQMRFNNGGTYTFHNVTANHSIKIATKQKEFTLSASSVNGTITETQTLICGNTATFTFYPTDDCYIFDGLFVDGVPVVAVGDTAYTFFNVKANHTILAKFKQVLYAIISSSSLYGSITPLGTIDAFCGFDQMFCFVPQTPPNQESVLDYIVVDEDTIPAADIINSCYTFEDVTEPHTIHAVFKRVTFTILATADEHSTITPNGYIEVVKGENYNFVIGVTDNCYEIDSVFIDGAYDHSVTIQMRFNNGGVFTFPNVTANHSIKISTKQKEFILSSSSVNGSITETQTVICGNTVIFTFYPTDDCYIFDGLFIDGASAVAVGDTAYTFTNVIENHTILAKFKQKQFAITSSCSLYGAISPPPGTIDVLCGFDQTYCFVPQTPPNQESVLEYIVVDGDTIAAADLINNCYTFEDVTEPHQIHAVFKRVTFTILATADEHSTITPNGYIEVVKGESYNFMVEVINDCYEIDSVFIDGAYNYNATIQMKYNHGGVYTFPNVTVNHSIKISTKQKEFILSSSSVNGSITETQTVICGNNQTFTFFPVDDCYEFDGLFVDDVSVVAVGDTAYTFTNVIKNHTIIAKFKQKQYAITSSSSLYGNITPLGTINVFCGEDQAFSFVPQTQESKLDYIVVDGDTIYAEDITNNSYTFENVTEPHQIYAAFKRLTFTIAATTDGHSTITPAGNIEVIKGESCNLAIEVTDDRYEIDSVFIDDNYDQNATILVKYNGVFTFQYVTADHSIRISTKSKLSIENIEPSAIKVYPNPVDDILVIESTDLKIGDRIDIFDMSGKLVLSLNINETNKVSINVGGLSQGTYIFKLGNIHGKFVKK